MALIIPGKKKDLGGGFVVNRLLPAIERRTVGPFVFLDHFGPTVIGAEMNIDVRPHPHVGLATVTYLMDGAMMHRDSLGSSQRIEPGAINWMTAGRGIVHSERRPEDLRGKRYGLHGLQMWVALPRALEEQPPQFAHTGAAELPAFEEQGVTVRVLVGTAFGRRSPVKPASETLLVSVICRAGSNFRLPVLAEEMAVLPVSTTVTVDGVIVPAGSLAVLADRTEYGIQASEGGELVVVGGAPVDGPRHLWWNFVSSSEDRIRRAADDWANGRFDRVEGETESIPLPPLPQSLR